MAGRSDDEIRCSFCGKSQGQVRKLIAGPKGAYICDECVDICAEIIEEEFENEEETGTAEETEQINLLKPEELKAFLDDYVIGQDQAKRFFPLQYITITRELWQGTIWAWNCRRATS